MFFLCTIIGGQAQTSSETSEVGFFAEEAIPDDLSVDRVKPAQIARMFAHFHDPGLAVEFD